MHEVTYSKLVAQIVDMMLVDTRSTVVQQIAAKWAADTLAIVDDVLQQPTEAMVKAAAAAFAEGGTFADQLKAALAVSPLHPDGPDAGARILAELGILPFKAKPRDASALSKAAQDVLAERQRQIEVEGFDPRHDGANDDDGSLAAAAAVYAWAGSKSINWHANTSTGAWRAATIAKMLWPWAWVWFKPTSRRRDLVKAGALIIAAIEQIDRAEGKGTAQ